MPKGMNESPAAQGRMVRLPPIRRDASNVAMSGFLDMGVLAEIGRCGSRATRYGFDAYNVFNTVDIGNYVDYMIDSYPEACSRIKDLVGETVLYHRQNGALCDSTGIAVYLPTEVSTLPGLVYYLDYIYNVSNNDSVSALYYYKQAGCLNEDLKEYVATLTDAEPKVLDVTPFTKFSKTEPTFDADGFLIPVEDELQNLMTEYELEVGQYDEDKNTITYYGRDQVLYLDGEGSLCSNFDGSWICLNGAPLYVDVVSSTASVIEYMAHVYYDGSEYEWTNIVIAQDNEPLTGAAIHYNSAGPATDPGTQPDSQPATFPTQDEAPVVKLSFFERIIQMILDFFARLFGR